MGEQNATHGWMVREVFLEERATACRLRRKDMVKYGQQRAVLGRV